MPSGLCWSCRRPVVLEQSAASAGGVAVGQCWSCHRLVGLGAVAIGWVLELSASVGAGAFGVFRCWSFRRRVVLELLPSGRCCSSQRRSALKLSPSVRCWSCRRRSVFERASCICRSVLELSPSGLCWSCHRQVVLEQSAAVSAGAGAVGLVLELLSPSSGVGAVGDGQCPLLSIVVHADPNPKRAFQVISPSFV